MASPFVHLEILGPRASLDAWLAVLQDHGGCHVADALVALEGEAGIGRPAPTSSELRASLLQSEAARALGSVERVLPLSAPDEDVSARPLWAVGARGVGEVDVEALRDEALQVGGRIRQALEEARAAEHAVEEAEGVRLALRALDAGGEAKVGGRVWLVAREGGRPRRLVRALARAGHQVKAVEGAVGTVVAAWGGEGLGTAVEEDAAAGRVRPLPWPEDLQGRDLPAARRAADERLVAARRHLDDAVVRLRRRIDEDGPRGRLLLDALADGASRSAAWQRLASTEHAVAARVFVRREDVTSLRRRLSVAFGREVVVRDLAPAADPPALPRTVAGLPFAALDGLRPPCFGEVPVASLLALAVPLAVGVILADLAGGLLLLLVGAVIGAGAAAGSPRRDTALLGQLGGLVALLGGILGGRAFGDAGVHWFGAGWGIAPGANLLPALDPFRGILLVLGAVALLLAAWGVVCAARAWRRRRSARAWTAVVATLEFLAVAGAGAAVLLPAHPLRVLWVLAPAAGLGILLLAPVVGMRAGLGRLLLDLVGVLRLVAVAGLALALIETGFGTLDDLNTIRIVLGPLVIILGALAIVVDPAHAAMGVPYDLPLGSRRLATPFTPLVRRVVRARGRPSA